MSVTITKRGAKLSVNPELGIYVSNDVWIITGLTALTPVAIPHGFVNGNGSPLTPSVLIPFPVSITGAAGVASADIDTTNGGSVANGTGFGADTQNIYLFPPSNCTATGLYLEY